MEERWPWEAEESLEAPEPFAHQRHEAAIKENLPRVVKLLPAQGTVMGSSSPHQTGDIVCYDILKRAPVYDLTSHYSDIPPKAPARGAHRHISAPTLFCLSGRGWEINDGKTYSFGTYDMLVVPFYISRWTEAAARGLDVMAQEISPGELSGEHRHIFEELLLVGKGRGYDLHEGRRYPWEEGDLICVPPMIAHQHVNDGKDAVRLVSVWPQQPGNELLGGIEQIRNASDWKS